MKHIFQDMSDIIPEGGRIENGKNFIVRTPEDLSTLKDETRKQNAIKKSVTEELNSLKPKNLFDTKVSIRERDTLGAVAFGVDGATTVDGKKGLNIKWGSKVEYFNKEGVVARKTTLIKTKKPLMPGDIVSFREEGSKTIIMVHPGRKYSPKKYYAEYAKNKTNKASLEIPAKEISEEKFKAKAKRLIEQLKEEDKIQWNRNLDVMLNNFERTDKKFKKDWLKQLELAL